MRYITTLSLLFIIIGTLHYAQGQTRRTRTSFHKTENIEALSVLVPGDDKNIEDVMDERLEAATGERRKKTKGYNAFLGVRHLEISDRVLDIYYKVEKAGTRDNPAGEVIMIMALGNETFITSDRFPEEFENARRYLDQIPLEVRIYELGLAIEEQEKNLDKAYKSYEKMGQDSLNLEQELIETQAAIEQNIQDRKDQRASIAEEAAKLSEFKALLDQEKRRALAPRDSMNAKGLRENDEDQ